MIQNLRFNHSEGEASPIELSRLSALRKRDSEISNPTRLDFHIIQFVVEGKGRHWLDFEQVKLRRGDLIHIRPSQVHSFDARSHHEAFLLLFLPEAVPDSGLVELLNIYMTDVLRPKGADFELLLGLLKQYESQQSLRGDINPHRLGPYLLGAIVTAVGDILRPKAEGGSCSGSGPARLVHAFERLLEENSASRRDLGWYASQLNATSRTLARACHTVRGASPKRLLDARIALEAKRKLILSQDTVEEVAFILGFSESTNFVKFFKRIAGQTPEEFRRVQGRRTSSTS